MYKIVRKKDRPLTVRMETELYNNLERLFINRGDVYKHQYRNLSEYIRYILESFVNYNRNIQRSGYTTYGVM